MDCSLPGSSVCGISQARILGGLPFPSLRDLPDPGAELTSPSLAGGCFPAEPPGKPVSICGKCQLVNVLKNSHKDKK